MAEEAPQEDSRTCVKCGGVLDITSGACPWCAHPITAAEKPEAPDSNPPTTAVWLTAGLGGLLFLVSFLVPVTTGSAHGYFMSTWTSNFFMFFGIGFLIVALALHMRG